MTSRSEDRDDASKSNVPSIFTGNQTYRPPPPQPQTEPSSSHANEKSDSPTPLATFRTRTGSTSAQSSSSDYPISPDAIDRVFPIRSVVSVAPTPQPQRSTDQIESYFAQARRGVYRQPSPTSPGGTSEGIRGFEDAVSDNPELQKRIEEHVNAIHTSQGAAGRRRIGSTGPKPSHVVGAFGTGYQIQTDAQSDRSGSTTARPRSAHAGSAGGRSNASVHSGPDADEPGVLLTARFKHVMTEEGHAVITGRDGDTLQRCEDEPIHIPGAIQSFGALVALHEVSEGKLQARVVSENSKRVVGYSPLQLFALESFTDILSEDQADNLLDHVDFVRDEGTDVEANGPEVFTISIRDPTRRSHKLWCAIHVNTSNPDLVICEFELEDDLEFPLVPTLDETAEPPEDTLHGDPTDDELRESTEVQSRPLRVLRSARKRKGEAAAMEVFNVTSQVQEQLAQAPNLEQFLKVLVGVVKELTGFHRVMIYQFDQSFNGKVVTELVDPRATKDLYKGLHFPASDIPAQARNLYKLNKVRLLYDRDQETARLVCRTTDDLNTPLDLTHSYLRAMSPIHIKYLANMAVRSSMSISINAFDELWGLIACHAYGSKGTRVSFPIRKMCRLVGDSASRNIERLSYASRLQARKLINTAPSSKNPSGYIIASSDDLLSLFDADFGLLSIHDETKILGKLEGTQEALALLEYLRMRRFTSVIMSHELRFDFPDLRYQPGFQVIAGLLLVPLSVGGNDFIVFFRKGQLREVKWAGNPYEKFIKEGTQAYLEPRKSFKTWTETVIGKCREWSEEEMETASVLCLVYGKFIEVWRQKEQALQNTQLTKLLLQNSAHEVRTPLNAIINYLEIALEGTLDSETRDNLAKSHSASKSLIYVINDLLDLTKTEASNQLVHDEAFDLHMTFREAVDMFTGDARRKGVEFEIIEDPGLPEKVVGDPRRVRQAISNITANAIEATTQGSIRVEMAVSARYEHSVDVEVVVEDTGCGIPGSKLDQLFVELEQAQGEGSSLIEETLAPSSVVSATAADDEAKKPKRTLGLGLAVVARIIRNMDGQLRLKSEVGKGSRFVIVFPFDLPVSESRPSSKSKNQSQQSGSSSTEIGRKQTLQAEEVTLVAKPAGLRPSSDRAISPATQSSPRLSRQNSGGSMKSLTSTRSVNSGHSGKSDADRLIEAIQQPHMVEGPGTSGEVASPTRPKIGRRKSKRTSMQDSYHTVGQEGTVPAHLRVGHTPSQGSQDIKDSSAPLTAVRMPNEGLTDFDTTHVHFELDQLGQIEGMPSKEDTQVNADNMKVLVAEDDPINSKIIQKRLQKSGHEPFLTVNGEDCASQYCEKAGFFDVILMDMQMPIVDGSGSAKMIRAHEKANPSHDLSSRAVLNGRVPIIAVSASLVEREVETYVQHGFDGWILKPIAFDRLSELMLGIVDEKVRADNLYRPGQWEQGGWFHMGQRDVGVTPAAADVPVLSASPPPLTEVVDSATREERPGTEQQQQGQEQDTSAGQDAPPTATTGAREGSES